jgi:integrase
VRVKRRQGQGSITPLPDGRFWVRGPRQPDGSRPSLGYVANEDEAELLLRGAAHPVHVKQGCPTFAKFGEEILNEREEGGTRGVDQERRRFSKHLAGALFAKKPLDKITTPDGAEWLRAMARKDADDRRGKRKISKATVQRALALALAVFDAAGPQNRGLIDKNPFLGLEARGAENKSKDAWTFLTVAEQELVRAGHPDVTEAERLAILFGAGSGIRQGEQFNLKLEDLHVGPEDAEPYATIRYGSKDREVKNGKTYNAPIFGIALQAIRAWLEIRTAYLGGARTDLVWSSPTGCRRAVGKPLGTGAYRPAERGTHVLKSGKPVRVAPGQGTHVYVDRLKEVLRLCGIERNVRWHDMRHTCGSSLIQGAWGEPWRLEEVKQMLNHSSIAVTERYAHLGETALKNAAKKVRPVGGPLVGEGTGGCSATGTISNDSELVGRAGVEPATYGLKGPSVIELLRGLAREKSADNQLVTNLAATLAALLEAIP